MSTRPQFRSLPLIYILLLISGNLFACSGVAENSSAQADPQALRIIIGFRSTDISPQDSDVIQTVSKKLNAEMEFVRKLSGNAAVYLIRTQLSEQDLHTRLAQLKTIPYIRYAEFDQRYRIQTR